MNRRNFMGSTFTLGAGAVMGPVVARASEPAASPGFPNSYSSFDDWLAAARESSLRYLHEAGAADTRRFIRFLSIWAATMPKPVLPELGRIEGANARLEMATIAPGRPFVVSAFRMAPGCLLPAHCHPGGGGITTCLEGSLLLQHFELCEGSAAYTKTGATAEVRQVQVAQLVEGRATQFTPTEANLHQLRAGPEGATGIDIAVQWQGAGEFSFLKLKEDLSPSRFSAETRLRGTWTGMNIADGYVG